MCPVISEIHDKAGGVSVTGQHAEPTAASQVADGLLKPRGAAVHLRLSPNTTAVHSVQAGRAEGSRK